MKKSTNYGFTGDLWVYLFIILLCLFISSCNNDDSVVIDTSGVDTIDLFNQGDVCYTVNHFEACSKPQKVVFDGLFLKLTHSKFMFNTIIEPGTIDIADKGSDIYQIVNYFPGEKSYVKMTEGIITLDSIVDNRIFGSFDLYGEKVEQNGTMQLDTTMIFTGRFEGVEYE